MYETRECKNYENARKDRFNFRTGGSLANLSKDQRRCGFFTCNVVIVAFHVTLAKVRKLARFSHFTVRSPQSYFWFFDSRQFPFCTVLSGRFTAVQSQQLHLPADRYRVVRLPPARLGEVLLQLLGDRGVDVPLALLARDPAVLEGIVAGKSVLNVDTHE